MVTPFLHPGPRTLRRAAGGAELSPRLRRHLAACDQCRTRVGFMRDLVRQARTLEGPVAGDRLRERIHARIAAGDRIILPGADPRQARWNTPRWIAAGLAAVLVGFWIVDTGRVSLRGSAPAGAAANATGTQPGQRRAFAGQVRVLALSSTFSRTDLPALRRVSERLARRGIAVQTVSRPPSDTFGAYLHRALADSEGSAQPAYYVLDAHGRVRFTGSDPDAVFDEAVALSQTRP